MNGQDAFINEGTPFSPEWLVLEGAALTGNILVTGSIGSGKSQGTVLPFLDQILGNFSERPALLAIDPKNTFIPKAKQIIERRGMSDHLLHLSLDGAVTFNPIYYPDALKNSRFLDIAQMIRAAAVNFMGKSFDSPFWEISAFNLVKNSLVYCAAVNGYYTLRDLYSVMVQAVEGNLGAKLGECLRDERFGEEERYNISCAVDYFAREYKQLDEKVRTGILATSTSFLNQFQEYRAGRIFCPAEDQLSIPSMDEVVDQGRLLLFDIKSPALARSMGTFIKLHYQQSILNRLSDGRGSSRYAVLLIDEYQDVVSTGAGSTLGDERFLAKSREARAVTIAAAQSYSSIENSVGRDRAARELFQNFRTRIACHSTDLATIKSFQELAGQYDRKKQSHSVSEISQHTERNFVLGGFDLKEATISESVSTNEQKEYFLTGKEFSRLKNFEAYCLAYDGVESKFHKLYLKPYFLEKKETLHRDLLKSIKTKATAMAIALGLLSPSPSHAFPTVCSAVDTPDFRSCLNFTVSGSMCGWPIPRPCARISYYVPQTMIEVVSNPKETFFRGLPGVEAQLATTLDVVPFSAEDDDNSYSYHAHAISAPFASIPFHLLPCGGAPIDRFCFSAMSEHVSAHWRTGSADLLQPGFLAWSLSPKACLVRGALAGGGTSTPSSGSYPGCSFSMDWLPKYPPSAHDTCTGWGPFFPRSGTYQGTSHVGAALMIAARLKSLGSEVFKTVPGSPDEKWQMISPQSSSCFREGENLGSLETWRRVNEWRRPLSGHPKNFLFTVWKRVGCTIDWPAVPAVYAAIEMMSAVCKL